MIIQVTSRIVKDGTPSCWYIPGCLGEHYLELNMDEQTRIITRADDLGSFHSANMAIMDAYKNGVLRNSSVIVPAEHFDEAAEMFSGEKGFCVGLHAALTCEWNTVRWRPLLPADTVPCIVEEDGTLHHSTMGLHEKGPVFDQMLAEIQAQLDKARAAGLDIKYVDSHMAFGWVFEDSDEHRFDEPFERWAEKEGLLWHKKFYGRLPDVEDAPEDPVAHQAAKIRNAGPGQYIYVTHPAYVDDEMNQACYDDKKPGEIAQERDLQRRMFMDPAIVEAFEQSGAVPIRYDEATPL